MRPPPPPLNTPNTPTQKTYTYDIKPLRDSGGPDKLVMGMDSTLDAVLAGTQGLTGATQGGGGGSVHSFEVGGATRKGAGGWRSPRARAGGFAVHQQRRSRLVPRRVVACRRPPAACLCADTFRTLPLPA